MKTKRITSIVLVMVLLASALPLVVMPAAAQQAGIPCDDGNNELTRDELVNAILPYMLGEGSHTLDEVRDAAWVYAYWDGKPEEITDSAGREVTICRPVERIIPMSSWSYEPIWILEAQDKVVGVTSTLKESAGAWLLGIQDKPTVGTYKELDYEKVLEVNPQIVITGSNKAEEIAEKLAPAGITVVAMSFRSQEKFDNDLKILAKILGKDERAREFISWRQNCIDEIKERTEELEPEEKIKVYGESNARFWLTPTKDSGFHGVITTAGGNNIAGDLPGKYVDVESEWVVNESPEVIVIAATMSDWIPGPGLDYFADESDIADTKQYLEETYNRTGLMETDAAKEGRVYLLHGYVAEGACRSFVGVGYCAKWFYPEQFEDLEPEEYHREYFEEWLDMEYKGVWAYPPVS